MKRLAAVLLLVSCASEPTPLPPKAPPPPPKAAPVAAAPAPAPKVETPEPIAVPTYMADKPVPTGTPAFVPPTPESHKLKNGLEVLLLPRHAFPLVALTMVVRAGGAADPARLPGLAAATFDMLDEGAGKLNALEIADLLNLLGAELHTLTMRDGGVISIDVLKKNLGAALGVLSDVVLHPKLDPDEWTRVRGERLAALVTARDRPDMVARDVTDRVLFGDDHPYGRPLNGTPETLKDMSIDDVRRFHEQRFRPNNAVLVVVGDVAWTELGPELERVFGQWKKKAVPKVVVPPAPRKKLPALVLVDKPGAPQSVVKMATRGVARSTLMFDALEAWKTVLGGSFTSRLNANLREKNGYTYGARSKFSYWKSGGAFEAGAAIFTAKTGPGLVEMRKEVTAMLAAEVTPEELGKAKSLLIHDLVERSGTNAALSQVLADYSLQGLPMSDLQKVQAKLEAITAADVLAKAKKVLGAAADMSIVIVGDKKTIEPELHKLGLPAPVLRGVDGKSL